MKFIASKLSFKLNILFLCFSFCFFNLLSCFAQSGFSNISTFLNKGKYDELKSESSFDKPLTIKEILIEGNRLVPDEIILENLDTMVGAKFDRDKILSDLETIDRLGYFVRESIQATPEVTETGILLKIRIEENNPITNVQVIGNNVVRTDELLFLVQDLIGKPESLARISRTLDSIEKKYHESGYLLARIKDLKVDPDGTLTIALDEGLIEKILIKGNDKTKEHYIRRFISNHNQSEPYNEILLVQDLRSLHGTGLFEDIKRTLTPSHLSPGKYDLNIEVVEKRSSSFGFGGGVNTLNGVFANLGYNNNNLFGEGKTFSINTQVGTGILANALIDQRFLSEGKTIQVEARYSDPSFLGTKNSVSFFAHGYTFNSYLVDLAQERNFGIGASIMRPLGMNFFGGFDLAGESVEMKEYGPEATNFLVNQLVSVEDGKYLGDITEKTAFKPGEEFGKHNEAIKREEASELAKSIREAQLKAGNFIQVNPTIAYDTRDDKLNPAKGWYNKVNIGQAVGIGNDSYTKLGIDIRRYIPIGQKTTLAFNLQGASSLIGDIPMYGQFKAGGFYGVRGYRSFSDLGIGTRSLLASAEIRTPVLDTIPGFQNTPIGKNLKLVAFGDYGYVGGNSTINRLFNRLSTAISTGIGIRANIPVLGSIRVDYGIPLLKPLWSTNSILGRFNFGFAERF